MGEQFAKFTFDILRGAPPNPALSPASLRMATWGSQYINSSQLRQKLSLNNYKYQHLKFLFLRGVAGKNFITSNLN